MRRLTPRTWDRLRLLAGLLLLALFLCALPSRFTAPARILFSELTGPAQTQAFQRAGDAAAAGGSLIEMFRSRDRERALEAEVARLRNRNAELEEVVRRQNDHIESREQFFKSLAPRFRALHAPLAAYETAAVRRSITVRAGRRDGVEPGMAAMADGALAGVVSECGPWHCRVRLITDPDSTLPCRRSRRRDQRVYVLRGTGGETCRVDWMDREAFVHPGDTIFAASLLPDVNSNLQLPDGLPVATVIGVEPDRMRPLFHLVEAVPLANLSRLEYVQILVPVARTDP